MKQAQVYRLLIIALVSVTMSTAMILSGCGDDTIDPSGQTTTSSISFPPDKPEEDSSSPIITILSPVQGQVVTDQIVAQGMCFDDSELLSIRLTLDDRDPVIAQGLDNWMSSFHNIGFGNHSLIVEATDAWFNKSMAVVSFQRLDKDSVSPSITITSPETNSWQDHSFTVSGTASDDQELAKLEIQLDEYPFASMEIEESWDFTFQDLTPGNHTLIAKATDSEGNTSFDSIVVTVETDSPSITLTQPINDTYIIDTYSIEGTAEDGVGSGIQSVEVRIDGGDWILADGTETWSYTWDTSSLSSGDHVLEVRTTDAIGLPSETISVNTKILHRELVGNMINDDTEYSAVGRPHIALDGDTPYVAVTQFNGVYDQVHVYKYDGSDWVRLGNYVNNSATKNARSQRIALDPTGVPYVTFVELGATHDNIYVRKWDDGGSTWVDVGPQPLNNNTGENAYDPDIAFNGEVPYVVFREWEDSPNEYRGYVKYYDSTGNTWVQLGGNFNYESSNSRRVYTTRIAFTGPYPTIAFREYEGSDYIGRHRQWDGDSWGGYNKFSRDHSNRNTDGVNIAFDGTKPCFAWREEYGSSYIYSLFCRCYEHNGFKNIGGVLNLYTNRHTNNPSFAIWEGKYYLAWHEYNGTTNHVYIKFWDGTDWHLLGNYANFDPIFDAFNPDVAVSHTTSPKLYTAFLQNTGTCNKLYMYSYDTP